MPEEPCVLIVDDRASDAELVTHAFRRSRPNVRAEICVSGAQALERLTRKDLPRPGLILMDLKMPGMDGHEVLKRIKEDPALRSIPVVVFTGSRLEEDIARSYDLGANCYLAKPTTAAGYGAIVDELYRFWMAIKQLPPEV